MTAKEALENILTYVYEDADKNPSQEIKGFGVAISALKKQIPKKVKSVPIGNINYYKCPECGEISGVNAEYCSCCGQKLEWED